MNTIDDDDEIEVQEKILIKLLCVYKGNARGLKKYPLKWLGMEEIGYIELKYKL